MKWRLASAMALLTVFLVILTGSAQAGAPTGADSACSWTGSLPSYCDFREAIRQPGDTAMFVGTFSVSMSHVYLLRVWPDDILNKAIYTDASGKTTDLLPLLKMITVNPGGPADSALAAVMSKRGVNISAGELLPQNTYTVDLGAVGAGAWIELDVQDDANKQVNRGVGVSIGDAGDAYTVDLSGNRVVATSAVNTAAVIAPTAFSGPASKQTFVDWKLSVNKFSPAMATVSTNVLGAGKNALFTFAGSFDSALNAGAPMQCQEVDKSVSGEMFTLMACRRTDGQILAAGSMIVVNGSFIEIWPVVNKPLPTGW